MTAALLLLVGLAQAADPVALREACVDGDPGACEALMPMRSERWALLDAACDGGLNRACLELGHALSDDVALRDPLEARPWLEAACGAGHDESCARLQAARGPAVVLSPEGIEVDGALQVRFVRTGQWMLNPSSVDGDLIKPVYGVLRSKAREAGLERHGALPVPLELRVDARVPVAVVEDLLYTASEAGWRSLRVGDIRDGAEDLVDVWLPSLGSARVLSPVAQAAAAARPEGVVLQGAIGPEAIKKGLRDGQPGLQACWEAAVRKDPLQGGRIELRFIVGIDGDVNDAAVRASDLDNPQLEDCIVRAFEDMHFPAPTGGGVATVDYPMVLEPVYADEGVQSP